MPATAGMHMGHRALDTCVLLAAILASPAAAAQPCPDLAGATRIESDRYVISYRTRPDRIAVGQHFAMDLVVCPRKGGAIAADDLRTDAHMAERRHGMNCGTVVKAVDGMGYAAEGFMFHMPGRWEFIFEVRAEGRTDRITRTVTLE